MKKKFICPVCGYPDLDEAPLEYLEGNIMHYSYYKGASTFCICPCCGTEFGYTDYEKTWDKLRKEWIDSGYNWKHTTTPEPSNWNPKEQLKNIEKIPKAPENVRKIMPIKRKKLLKY
jgi:hypothetical protein